MSGDGTGASMTLPIEPVTRPFDAVVELPGSKSYSNRALLVAALAAGRSEITEALFSDDTRYMHRALEALGVRVQADATARSFVVDGVDGRLPATAATLEVGNAGTAARFLTAAVALGHGTFVVDGSPAMRKRPIQPLLDGLRPSASTPRARTATAARPWSCAPAGCRAAAPGCAATSPASTSARCCWPRRTPRATWRSRSRATLVSAPYIAMTLSTMAAFGVRAERDGVAEVGREPVGGRRSGRHRLLGIEAPRPQLGRHDLLARFQRRDRDGARGARAAGRSRRRGPTCGWPCRAG